MSRPAGRRRGSGFALVEVLAALLVAAFAVLGLTSLQAVQRGAAEQARHLGEALRGAQAALEQARGLEANALPGAPAAMPAPASNAAFDRQLTLQPMAPAVTGATVTVRWTDRRGAPQALVLRTLIADAAPDLVGARLAVAPGGPVRTAPPFAGGLPAGAVGRGDGTYRFEPPGGRGLAWILAGDTGEVLETCDREGRCTRLTALLLQGHVRFAPGPGAPGPAQAEHPPGPVQPLAVRLALSRPREATVDCVAHPQDATALAFHCPVPLAPGEQAAWSGQVVLDGLRWATSARDADPSAWRACRYGAPADPPGAAPAPAARNFLVMRAGDGVQPFACPGDDPATPWLDGRTWHHQPPA